MGDAHVMVVDGVGDEKDRAAVATTDHKILNRLVGDFDSTTNDVVDDGDAIVGPRSATTSNWACSPMASSVRRRLR